MLSMPSSARRLLIGVALVTVAGCSKSPTDPGTNPRLISQVVARLSAQGSAAQVLTAPAPAPAGGPALGLGANAVIIPGGTNQVRVQAASLLAHVLVSAVGYEGHLDVALGTPTNNVVVLLEFTQSLAQDLTLSVQAVDVSGAVGPATTLPLQTLAAGTGEVQVNLSWDTLVDLDLHVVQPDGEEVYWDHTKAASGGTLDVDSNTACQIDARNNENIYWPTGKAPRGDYKVRVDYWSNCGQPLVNWVVRVVVKGQATVYAGNLTGIGDHGGQGSGLPITTFRVN